MILHSHYTYNNDNGKHKDNTAKVSVSEKAKKKKRSQCLSQKQKEWTDEKRNIACHSQHTHNGTFVSVYHSSQVRYYLFVYKRYEYPANVNSMNWHIRNWNNAKRKRRDEEKKSFDWVKNKRRQEKTVRSFFLYTKLYYYYYYCNGFPQNAETTHWKLGVRMSRMPYVWIYRAQWPSQIEHTLPRIE